LISRFLNFLNMFIEFILKSLKPFWNTILVIYSENFVDFQICYIRPFNILFQINLFLTNSCRVQTLLITFKEEAAETSGVRSLFYVVIIIGFRYQTRLFLFRTFCNIRLNIYVVLIILAESLQKTKLLSLILSNWNCLVLKHQIFIWRY
jgi:hypothetical protein